MQADDGNRTRDLLTTNEVRYRLCHISKNMTATIHNTTILPVECQTKTYASGVDFIGASW